MASMPFDDQALVSALSKKLVTQVAPEELDLFDELFADFVQNPQPPDLTRSKHDDALGSGLGVVMAAVTPAAAAISNVAIGFVKKTLQTTQQASTERVRALLQAHLQATAPEGEPMLEKTHLEQLRQVTFNTAIQYGMNHAQAEQLTNSVLVSLILGPSANVEAVKAVTVLFLASDPTDLSRLRLGEELREIQEKLQLARLRDHFDLQQRMSVRPTDISQALLDTQPQIVHFSGHGTSSGTLCFENQMGETQPIQPDALTALFEQFTNQINCVVLNACYSELQARAIAKHIRYVIGMNREIGDKAAIAFAIGFFQALGAGRTVEEAYQLGCVQIRLQDIPEHLTPVLIKKGQASAWVNAHGPD